jgi:fumarate hydratase class II
LNTTLPLLAHCLHESIGCLENANRLLTKQCVAGLEAEGERCSELVARSLMLVTALVPHLGYDVAGRVAKRAFVENRTLRDVVLDEKLLDAATLDRALDPRTMTSAAEG